MVLGNKCYDCGFKLIEYSNGLQNNIVDEDPIKLVKALGFRTKLELR
jgi:hypothetical protein